MRCNWRRWLWGIVPLLVLSWVAVQAEHGRIERDLLARAGGALSQSGFGWAVPAFNGRDGLLTGRAPLESEQGKAAEVLRMVWGVRQVENRASLVELPEKYLWWASRRNNRIRLSGHVPSLTARQAILGVTRVSFPGFELVDRMVVTRGVPSTDVWLGGVSFALKQLASIKRGDVRLEDLSLAMSGEAEDVAGYRAVKSALGQLPKGIKLTSDTVTPPTVSPFTWAAQFTGGRLVLTGHAPNEAIRDELLAAAKASVASGTVDDQMEPGDGAPQGFAIAAVAALRALPRLDSGTADLKDSVLVLSGLARDAATSDAMRGGLKAALPAGIKLMDQVRVKEAPPPPALVPPPPPKESEPVPQPPPQIKSETPPPSPTPAPTPVAPSVPGPSAAAGPGQEATPPPPPAATPPPPAPMPAPTPPPAAALPAPDAPRVASAGDPRAKVCEDTLTAAASAGTIQFQVGSADLEDTSIGTLDRMAQAVKSCPGMRIEVSGHASAEGGAEINQQLSIRRAQSVVAYLVRAGVDAAQLEAVGLGVTQPIAPNDTAENMARNRRIEFAVRPK